MEYEVAVTVQATARVRIDADGLPVVIALDISECKLGDLLPLENLEASP